MTVQYIDTEASLAHFCQEISDSTWMTVDTEFLREKTYSPQLCLIQVATENVVACIDPLSISDLTPLLNIFYSSDVTVVFHAARQDLELLFMIKGSLPPNIFDTQVAATILGYGDQIGYGNLVKQCINVDLDKAYSRTDWTRRPLSPAQINYAADDVRYLRDVYKILIQQLKEHNRTHWLDDDFAFLTDSKTYTVVPEDMWRKVKGFGRLKGLQLAILQKLAAWRERRAIKLNRPRRWILKDEILLDIAKLAPDTLDQLSLIRGLESTAIKHSGESLLEEVQQAKRLSKDLWPSLRKRHPLTQQQSAIVDMLMALVRRLCDDNAIAPVAVTSRKEVAELVGGETDLAVLQGWRNDIVGQHLKDFLEGNISISSSYSQLKIQQG